MDTGSRRARLSLAFTLVLAASLGGCATGGGSAGDAFSEESTRAIEIEVLNLNFADATLWIQRGNERIRLGTVTGKTEDTFSLAWPFSYETTITIDLLAGSRCTTGQLTADPGDTLYLEIPSVFVSGRCAE